jgi:uncharacterized membrane protein YgcG
MSMLRTLFTALIFLCIATPALAREQINRFDVLIEVQRNGDIIVSETLDVNVEGHQIRRGIFRDLPRYYEGEGERYAYDYNIISIRRDGEDEPYDTDHEGNAFKIIIGDEDVLLDHGPHLYEIRYRVRNQVRYFETHDEVYWNATGNYWAFPIMDARAVIVLPSGARVTQHAAYTGAPGATGSNFLYSRDGDRQQFEATKPLGAGEGLTVAVGFEKGLIDPPSAADQGAQLWQRYGAIGILGVSLLGLFYFLYRSWDRVGRDPTKGPIFPRYEAPRGYSPAATHYIYYRAMSGNRALIATLMNLAVKGRFAIDASEKKETHLTRASAPPEAADIAAEDLALERSIFGGGNSKTLGGKYDSGFTTAYTTFQSALDRKYGSPYFRWNIAYILIALALSIITVVVAATQIVNWMIWHTLAIVALALLNIIFMYLLPAPTTKGQEVRTEIEGFRLYMETAEKLQLNAAEPGKEAAPLMTKERYERFLPYAVALGVEQPWTKHFERLLPQEAESYNPTWSHGNLTGSRALAGVSSALVANMSSGVSSAMPQSSSSSGSGGGGSSGGGGGGGGGGGW